MGFWYDSQNRKHIRSAGIRSDGYFLRESMKQMCRKSYKNSLTGKKEQPSIAVSETLTAKSFYPVKASSGSMSHVELCQIK